MPRHDGESTAGSIRNTLALMRSKDLTDWEIRSILLYHPDIRHHGFQYPDWLFDGDDLIAAIRTAYDDGQGGAHNAHDANYLTFHRFRNFRELTMADSCVRLDDLKALPLEEVEVGEIIVRGRQLSLQPLATISVPFPIVHTCGTTYRVGSPDGLLRRLVAESELVSKSPRNAT
jgi:hypothetical protein